MSIGHAWEPDMFEGPHALTTPIRPITGQPSYRREDSIMTTDRTRQDLERLAVEMSKQDFDHVWTITADDLVTDYVNAEGYAVYAPDVVNDPDGDVDVMGDRDANGNGWEALTGMTGQYSYNGAVMHPSEDYGRGMAEMIADMSESSRVYGKTMVWAHVEVRDDNDDFPEGDPIGWAVVYREI